MERLQFQGQIKASSAADTLKRLKALHKELAAFDQDAVNLDSLSRVSAELVTRALFTHKDRGVRALTGACLVDILRLYAPEAPYTEHELKDIFGFLFRLLCQLKNKQDPLFAEYFYILESLANVKSIVLVVDLSSSDDLLLDYFKQAFDTIITPESSKHVEMSLAESLHSLLDEMPTVSQDIVEVLLEQLMPSKLKSNPAAYRLAADVCTASADKLQRYVSQHFAHTLSIAFSNKGDDDDSDSLDGDSSRANTPDPVAMTGGGSTSTSQTKVEPLPRSLIQAHDLMIAIHRAVPALLLSVIPVLVTELSGANPAVRKIACETFAAMLSNTSTTPASSSAAAGGASTSNGAASARGLVIGTSGAMDRDVRRRYPDAWREWLGRSRDKHRAVRSAVADALPDVWRAHPHAAREVEPHVARLLTDSDVKVRLAACDVFAKMDFETALRTVSKDMLIQLADRVNDTKSEVRKRAMDALGRFYDLAYTDIEARDDIAIDRFAWIPATILNTISRVEMSQRAIVRAEVDATLLKHILPLPKRVEDEGSQGQQTVQAWVDRFLIVLHHLEGTRPTKRRKIKSDEMDVDDEDEEEDEDEGEEDATPVDLADISSVPKLMLGVTRLGDGRPSPFEAFISACEAYNGGVIDQNEQQVKQRLKQATGYAAATLPDPQRATESLTKFAKANEKQVYRLLRTLLDPQTDLKTFIKTYSQTTKRLEQISATIVDTFILLLRSSARLFVSRSSIPVLIKRVQSPSAPQDRMALAILQFVAKREPVLLQTHIAELTRVLGDAKGNAKLIEMALHGLSRMYKLDRALVPDKKISERAKQYVTDGTPAQARWAATIISLDPAASKALAAQLVATLADRLEFFDSDISAVDDELVATVAALGRFARYASSSFETKSDVVIKFLIERIREVLQPPLDEDAPPPEPEWALDADLDSQTCLLLESVRVLTSRCLATGTDTSEAMEKQTAQTFELLSQLNELQNGSASGVTQSRLRLAAAHALLKLSVSSYRRSRLIQPHFNKLALTTQDICFEVRQGFIQRLLAYLRAHKITNAAYNCTLFYVAHDPEQEVRSDVKLFVSLRFQRLPVEHRTAQYELIFGRLIHMLAHHPDFERQDDAYEIPTMAKYVEYYLECVANQENVSLLYEIAGRIKATRDRLPEDLSENLYMMSEVAQYLINRLARDRNWSISQVAPGATRLPPDLYLPLQSKDEIAQIQKITYLTPELRTALDNAKPRKQTRPRKKKAAKDPDAAPAKRATPTKRKKAAAGSSGVKRRKTKKAESESEEEDEEDESGVEDSDVAEDASENEDVKPRKKAFSVDAERAKRRPGLRNRSEITLVSDKAVKSSSASKPTTKARKGRKADSDSDSDNDSEEVENRKPASESSTPTVSPARRSRAATKRK